MRQTMNPIATDNGRFKDGNPATGEYGTVVTAEHMNNVQDAVISMQNEIITVLRAAGIEVNPTDNTQLWQALQMIAGQVESITALRQFEPVRDRQVALVKGYYAGSHQGGGYFIADFGDTSTADNGGTVIMTAGGKRWKRILTKLTPFDFGAKLNEDSSSSFRAAAGVELDLANHTFITGYLPTSIKNGSLKLLANTISESDTLSLENVNISANNTSVSKAFNNAQLIINSANGVATLRLPVGGFNNNQTVLITTNNFTATALTTEANSYAHILAKGLWLVQSSSGTETVLFRNIKTKRETALDINTTISGMAKQIGSCIELSRNVKVLGSNISIENVEFKNKQITFESVTAKLNGIHSQEGLILINSNVNGELHVINSSAAGISIYNSVARIASSSVVSPATNGIMATQASSVMCEYAAVFDAGNSGVYAHTASTIEARYSSSCFNGKTGSSGSVGTGFESESGSTLFCERSCAIANDSYGFYVNATSQMASAHCCSLHNYHSFYALSGTMFARYSVSINPRYRGFYAYLNADINALDTNATGSRDYDYCAQGGSTITVAGYKNDASKFSTPLNLNGANKILSSAIFELNNYQSFNKGSNLPINSNGAIEVQTDYHIVGGGGHTQLAVINGRANEGALLHLRGLSASAPITVNSNGNIYLRNGDCVLSGFGDRLTLIYDSSAKKWVEVARNNDVTGSIRMPGWRKDGEFLMQWGSAEFNEGSNVTHVDFPIAFNEFLFAVPIDVTNGGLVEALAIRNPTATGMDIICPRYAGMVRYVAYGK